MQLLLTATGYEMRERVQAFRLGKARRLLDNLSPVEQEASLDLLERALSTAEDRKRP